MLASIHDATNLDLHVMALGEGGGLVALGALGDHVIGGRRGVGEHHGRLALGEQRIGFRPARGHGEDARAQLLPGLGGLVAIDLLHPQQETEARRRGARILQDDLLRGITVDEFVQRRRRVLQGLAVIDHGEIAIVEGHEIVVRPRRGRLGLGDVHPMLGEEPGLHRFGGEVGVEAQHNVGLGVLALELQAVEHGNRIARRHPFDGAVAGLLEGLLHLGAGAPLGDEAVISVDGERVLRQRGCGEREEREQSCERLLHNTSICRWMEDWTWPSGMSARNPSAGMIRIRFSGSGAEAPSQPLTRHPVESRLRGKASRVRWQEAFARSGR